MIEARENVFGGEKQVAHDYHQTTPGHQLGHFVQHCGRGGGRLLTGTGQRGQDLVKLPGWRGFKWATTVSAKSARPRRVE